MKKIIIFWTILLFPVVIQISIANGVETKKIPNFKKKYRKDKAVDSFKKICSAAQSLGLFIEPDFKLVVNNKKEFYAIQKERTVQISNKTIQFCYKKDNGDDKLAFILAHEIAHFVYKHIQKLNNQIDSLINVENEADKWAIIFMTLADYNPLSIEKEIVNKKFLYDIKKSSINSKDKLYFSHSLVDPKERTNKLVENINEIRKSAYCFKIGVNLIKAVDNADKLDDAEVLFNKIKMDYEDQFPEVYNNFGLIYFHKLIQDKLLNKKFYQFWLPVLLDSESEIDDFVRVRRVEGEKNLYKSIVYFNQATRIDRNYIPAYVNLSSAYIFSWFINKKKPEQKCYPKDFFLSLDEIFNNNLLKDNIFILNNKAIELYLDGTINDSINAFQKIIQKDIFPYKKYFHYNLGQIFFDKKVQQVEKAREHFTAFLKNDLKSDYSKNAKDNLKEIGSVYKSKNKPNQSSSKLLRQICKPLFRGQIVNDKRSKKLKKDYEKIAIIIDDDIEYLISNYYRKKDSCVYEISNKIIFEDKTINKKIADITTLPYPTKTHHEANGNITFIYQNVYNDKSVDCALCVNDTTIKKVIIYYNQETK